MFSLVGAAAGMLFGAAQASAQEVINLTLISGYPPPATWAGSAVDVYAPTVNQILAKSGKYTINWNMGISGQIVKPRGELEGVDGTDVGVEFLTEEPYGGQRRIGRGLTQAAQ